MKIGIFYVSAGHGHKKAAEALKEAFLDTPYAPDVELVDVVERGSALLQKTYVQTYQTLAVHFPWVWSFFFCLSNSKILSPLVNVARAMFNTFHLKRFSSWVRTQSFDLCVSTHFMPAYKLGKMKQNGQIQTKLVTVVTDYRVHRFWVNSGTDAYTTMTEEARQDILSIDSKARVAVLGIPISSKFSKSYDRSKTRLKLGLSDSDLTLLITTGSFGSGPLLQILEKLDDLSGLQTMVVCAQNETLYNTLKSESFKNRVLILGYVSNMEELMAASDAAIVKPGGLTLCEGLAQNVVLILTSPIPGQEEGNRHILLSRHAAYSLDQLETLPEIIRQIKTQASSYLEVKRQAAQLRKPQASRDIVTWITTL